MYFLVSQVYQLSTEGIAFRFLPDPRQVKNALEVVDFPFFHYIDQVICGVQNANGFNDTVIVSLVSIFVCLRDQIPLSVDDGWFDDSFDHVSLKLSELKINLTAAFDVGMDHVRYCRNLIVIYPYARLFWPCCMT